MLYLYARGGFIVNVIFVDGEFRSLQELLPLVELNITAAREHVPEVESIIRRIKEKVRAYTSEFAYRWIPTLLLIHTVYTAVFWLNAFVNGTENHGFSPHAIVTCMIVNHARDCKASPGEYVEAVVDREVTNTNEPRTHPCLCLAPSGNC